MGLLDKLETQRHYFNSGATLSYEFRKAALLKLRASMEKYENEIFDALYADLKKSKEEAWATENGFFLSELNYSIRNLKSWMKPVRVKDNLFNFPSKNAIASDSLGVILIIGPWNYPLQLLLAPLVGAIAAGNCIVLKPSEFAPATSSVLKKIILENFEEKYILFVEGDGATVIPEMMNNFTFDHVCFTGSTFVGQKIYEMAAKKLVPVTLELGGKSPVVVEKDANIKITAKRLAFTKFSNCGQMCVAPDYILVHESQKEKLVVALKEVIAAFFTENPAESYDYGKIINEKQFDRLVGYLKDGNILYGGQFDRDSLFIAPTLMDNVSLESPVMNEEIFGPILPIIPFSSDKDAIEIINRHKNPLAFYVFTENNSLAEAWLSKVPSGGSCINTCSVHLTNHRLPFGGRGTSGIGAYHGKHSFDRFSHKKAVLKSPTWIDPKVRYPSYKGRLGLFKKIIG